MARGIVWLINGPASIFREAVPVGLLSSSATLNPPPAPVAATDLIEAALPEAWRDGKANALAVVTALSAQRGKPLPWATVKSAIDAGVNTRWIELDPESSAAWPGDFANARHVIIQAAKPPESSRPGISDSRWEASGQKRLGTVTAAATLEYNGVQDLAEQIPEIIRAAVGHQIRFNIHIELSADNPPEPSVVEAINSLLANVSEGLKLQ